MAINREIGCFNESSSTSLHAQLFNMQESISKTRDAVLSHITALNSALRSTSAFSRSSMCPTPATPLETSRQFFPEIYNLESHVPRSCLIMTAAYEQLTLADATTNVNRLLYLKAPRQWHCLTLSIEISCSSRYWPITKTTRAEYRKWQSAIFSGAALLPFSLLAKIPGVSSPECGYLYRLRNWSVLIRR